jgi:hypothetical protein
VTAQDRVTTERLLYLLALNGYQAYRHTVVGNPAPQVANTFDRLTHPVPGDLVLEISTCQRWLHSDRSPGHALGWLLRVVQEPVMTQDGLDQLHQEGDYFDTPDETIATIPTEKVFYVKPLDGSIESARWIDADFIVVQTALYKGQY